MPYTTNLFWNHPKPQSELFDYSGGMINTPDTPVTLDQTKNPLPVIDTSNPQLMTAGFSWPFGGNNEQMKKDRSWYDNITFLNNNPFLSLGNIRNPMLPKSFHSTTPLSGITNTDAAQTMNTGNKYANLQDEAWANKKVIRTPGGEIVVDTESGQVAPDIASFSGDDIQEQVTETETLDPNWQHQLRLQEMNREGIQAPGMWDKFKGMFQRPEAKQKEFEAYEASMNPQGWGDFGDYRGNIWEGSGGNKINVVDPRTGITILQNKNFDSAYGSQSVEEMIAKKEAWARKRRAKGKEYLSTDMNAWLDAIDKGKGGADQAPKGPSTYDRGTFTGPHPDTPTKSPAQGGWHPGVAQGGYMRSRYNQGGRVGILSVF